MFSSDPLATSLTSGKLIEDVFSFVAPRIVTDVRKAWFIETIPELVDIPQEDLK